jgi:hypothetical protein
VPFALAHDRRSFFAAIHSSGFSGVAEIDARTSAVRHIKAFPDPASDQADGAFDGRWLVWSEYHSLTGLDDFTVWAWDSRSGQVTQVGAASQASAGEFWPSPLQAPDALNGIATWVQGTGPGDRRGPRLRPANRSRHDHPPRSRAGLLPLGRRLVGLARVAGPGPRDEDACRLGAHRQERSGAAGVAHAVRRLGAGHRRTRIAYPNAQYTSLRWSPSLRRSRADMSPPARTTTSTIRCR